MGFLDNIAGRLGYESKRAVAARSANVAVKQKAILQAQRTFTAGLTSRLTGSWSGMTSSFNQEVESRLPIMRNRSRGLWINDEYAAKYAHMLATHVVGPNGFTLQVRGGDYVPSEDGKGFQFQLDTVGNSLIEQHFAKWSKKGHCDITRKISFNQVCRLMVQGTARDGEYLVRKIRGQGKFSFMLQVLPIERLDHSFRAVLNNGNVVRMGVEYDSNGVVHAYHLHGTVPNDSDGRNVTTKRERVPATDIYHGFKSLYPEQIRGVPWLHPVMERMNMVHSYQDAAVVAARLGASKAGFITTPEQDGTALADAKDAATGDLLMDIEPGTFQTLPAGYGIETWNPEYPHANQESFIKTCLRGVAGGIGVSYNGFANDLEGVNFSSMRSGALDERDGWTSEQNWFIESFLCWLYPDWLEMALLSGAIRFPAGSALSATKLDKFSEHIWQGRRWGWVDPEKDINANILQIDKNLKSRSAIAAEQGLDFEDLMMQIAHEKEIAKANGVELDPPDKPPNADSKPTNNQAA